MYSLCQLPANTTRQHIDLAAPVQSVQLPPFSLLIWGNLNCKGVVFICLSVMFNNTINVNYTECQSGQTPNLMSSIIQLWNPMIYSWNSIIPNLQFHNDFLRSVNHYQTPKLIWSTIIWIMALHHRHNFGDSKLNCGATELQRFISLPLQLNKIKKPTLFHKISHNDFPFLCSVFNLHLRLFKASKHFSVWLYRQ